MTPSHAVKNGKRYRYYVSRPLITGSKTMAPDGRRIPAAEIERLVADRVCRFLSNGAEIFAAIQDCSHEVTEQKRLVERAAELSKEWRNLPPAQTRSVGHACPGGAGTGPILGRRVTRHERAVAAPFIMWMFTSLGESPRSSNGVV